MIDLNNSVLNFSKIQRGILVTDSQRMVLTNGTIRNDSVLLTSIAEVVVDDSDAGVQFRVLPEYVQAVESRENGMTPLTIGVVEESVNGGWQIKTLDHKELFVNRTNNVNTFEFSFTFTKTFRKFAGITISTVMTNPSSC